MQHKKKERPDGSCDKEGGGATCQVLFSFKAGSDAELSVEEGELLWLLKSHDLTGNSEWWLVQREGGAKGLFQQATWRLIKDLYVVFIFDCNCKLFNFISCILKFMKMFIE